MLAEKVKCEKAQVKHSMKLIEDGLRQDGLNKARRMKQCRVFQFARNSCCCVIQEGELAETRCVKRHAVFASNSNHCSIEGNQ